MLRPSITCRDTGMVGPNKARPFLWRIQTCIHDAGTSCNSTLRTKVCLTLCRRCLRVALNSATKRRNCPLRSMRTSAFWPRGLTRVVAAMTVHDDARAGRGNLGQHLAG